jgi:hypothetical protein
MISSCANPACSAPLEYRRGRIFRFRQSDPKDKEPKNSHAVRHFWLWAKCSETCSLYSTKTSQDLTGLEGNRKCLCLPLRDNFHWHVAELAVDPAPSKQRPPIVKVYLHRPPHRDPACDRQTLPQDAGPGACLPP